MERNSFIFFKWLLVKTRAKGYQIAPSDATRMDELGSRMDDKHYPLLGVFPFFRSTWLLPSEYFFIVLLEIFFFSYHVVVMIVVFVDNSYEAVAVPGFPSERSLEGCIHNSTIPCLDDTVWSKYRSNTTNAVLQ